MLDKAKFTEKAHTAILIALYEASSRSRKPVNPLHLLLGLLRADPELFQLLSPIKGADVVECLRDKLKRFASKRRESRSITERPPFSPAMQEIIKSAVAESRVRGHSRVNTGHLLLGLLTNDYMCDQTKMFGLIGRRKLSIKRMLTDCGVDIGLIIEKINDESLTPQSRPASGPVLRGKSSRMNAH